MLASSCTKKRLLTSIDPLSKLPPLIKQSNRVNNHLQFLLIEHFMIKTSVARFISEPEWSQQRSQIERPAYHPNSSYAF